jgi:hypothetical protein
MNLRNRWCGYTLAAAISLGTTASFALAQGKENPQHVATLDELKQQSARPAETRAENEASVRHLLSSEIGKKALKSASVDYERVDKAIGQLNDEELAKLADRSRKAESDFAAGFISAKTLAYIILAVVVIVVIVVLV